jgi:outer membrane protein assembly factor BamC
VPETPNVKSLPAVTPARLAVLALATWLAGCSSIASVFSGDKVDYHNVVKSPPLEVPPDLTQLSRESRYQTQGGVVSASAAGSTSAPAASAAPAMALSSQGAAHVERHGQQRWLVVPITPEALWPQLHAFWEQRGFSIETENPQAGLMETNWSEDRAKMAADAARNAISRLLGALFDTGERDRYRTRIERGAEGTEVYVSHQGAEEVFTKDGSGSTVWRARPNDPQLEAEMLTQLMVALGTKEEPARAAVTGAPEQPARARALAGSAALEVDEPFDRAWRRVGLALDRGGFTVEDRDRASGLYYVRYVDPKNAGKEEPGWWARLWGDKSNPQAAVRYRITVKASGDKTTVTVQTSVGGTDTGEIGQRIATQLVSELR